MHYCVITHETHLLPTALVFNKMSFVLFAICCCLRVLFAEEANTPSTLSNAFMLVMSLSWLSLSASDEDLTLAWTAGNECAVG